MMGMEEEDQAMVDLQAKDMMMDFETVEEWGQGIISTKDMIETKTEMEVDMITGEDMTIEIVE